MRPRSLLLFCLAFSSHAADTPVPVRDEPYHKVVFENEYVRMIDVQIPPGKTSLYHVHAVPSVIVYLTKSTNHSQTWGEQTTTPRHTSPGESRYAAYDEKPLTHRVTNLGSGLFRVWDIELLRPVSDREPCAVVAQLNVEFRWEQKRVRAYNVRLDAGGRCDFPAAACARLLVNISGELSAVSDTDARSKRELSAGGFIFLPAESRFQINNPGKEKAEGVLLELK